jgi:ribose transport system substrate-binding protein
MASISVEETMIEIRSLWRRTAVAGLALVAATGSGPARAAGAQYVVGVSNTLIGNGWREEMICSIKAEAKASGLVSRLVLANRNGGPAEQIADLRNLISAGANLIVLNPSSREALDPIIRQATQRGIVVVAVDQAVNAPEAYVVSNDQVAYGRVGAQWLFGQLHGKGNVVEMRGIDGVPADADRHEGFEAALKQYPGIKVVSQTFTGWSINTAAKQIKDLLASGQPIDGIWTSGIDAIVPEAYRTANKPFVPTVGADNNAFVGELVTWKPEGLVGVAVTNPPAVGGAGLAVGLAVLQKKPMPHVIKLTPEEWSNTTAQGVDKLKSAYDPKLDPYYSDDFTVPQYTTYTKEQLLACQGP